MAVVSAGLVVATVLSLLLIARYSCAQLPATTAIGYSSVASNDKRQAVSTSCNATKACNTTSRPAYEQLSTCDLHCGRGRCQLAWGQARCVCPHGYAGVVCQLIVGECSAPHAPCFNGGTCQRLLALSYSKHFNDTSSTDNNSSESDKEIPSFRHNVTAWLQQPAYVCLCPDGYTGDRCERCVDFSCFNTTYTNQTTTSLSQTVICRRHNSTPPSFSCNSTNNSSESQSEMADVSSASSCANTTCANGWCDRSETALCWCAGARRTGHHCQLDLCRCWPTCDDHNSALDSETQASAVANTPCVRKVCRQELLDSGVGVLCASYTSTDMNTTQQEEGCLFQPVDCLNDAVCSHKNGSAHCSCTAGFAGATCQRRVCSDQYCLHGGTCSLQTVDNTSEDVANGWTEWSATEPVCACLSGWTGSRCQRHTGCRSYCFNGATCVAANAGSDTSSDMPTCICAAGFVGVRCGTFVGGGADWSSSSQSAARYLVPSLVTVLLLVVVFLLVLGVFLWRRRIQRMFLHWRMSDDSAPVIENPVYAMSLE